MHTFHITAFMHFGFCDFFVYELFYSFCTRKNPKHKHRAPHQAKEAAVAWGKSAFSAMKFSSVLFVFVAWFLHAFFRYNFSFSLLYNFFIIICCCREKVSSPRRCFCGCRWPFVQLLVFVDNGMNCGRSLIQTHGRAGLENILESDTLITNDLQRAS